MVASPQGVCGFVSKSEGETAVFKNGWFGNIIKAPIGNITVGICYDSKRKRFYDNIKNETISLILFPHGCPANPEKPEEEISTIDFLRNSYVDAFHVPVVYTNSVGKQKYMPGMMGKMMKKVGFRMSGHNRIYAEKAKMIKVPIKKAFIGVETTLQLRHVDKEITFYGNDLIKGNTLFRELILKPDVKAGLKQYNQAILKERQKRQ